MPAPPSVFEFLDFRVFLQAWVDWKRRASPTFSYEQFARRAGLSKAALPNVIDGRRQPKTETLGGFARGMDLDQRERSFLDLLVELGSAANLEDHSAVLQRIFDHDDYPGGQRVDTAHLEHLSTWYRVAIYELARHPDFRPDVAWIAARLRPTVTPAEVEEALRVLRAEGLLPQDGQPVQRLHTTEEVASLAAFRVHLAFLDAAKEALIQVPHDQRSYSLLTVSVPAQVVPQLHAQIAAFMQQLSRLADAHRDRAEEVVQIQVQMWQATTTPDPED